MSLVAEYFDDLVFLYLIVSLFVVLIGTVRIMAKKNKGKENLFPLGQIEKLEIRPLSEKQIKEIFYLRDEVNLALEECHKEGAFRNQRTTL